MHNGKQLKYTISAVKIFFISIFERARAAAAAAATEMENTVRMRAKTGNGFKRVIHVNKKKTEEK